MAAHVGARFNLPHHRFECSMRGPGRPRVSNFQDTWNYPPERPSAGKNRITFSTLKYEISNPHGSERCWYLRSSGPPLLATNFLTRWCLDLSSVPWYRRTIRRRGRFQNLLFSLETKTHKAQLPSHLHRSFFHGRFIPVLSTPQHIAESPWDSLRTCAPALNINRAPEKIGMVAFLSLRASDALQEPRVSPEALPGPLRRCSVNRSRIETEER